MMFLRVEQVRFVFTRKCTVWLMTEAKISSSARRITRVFIRTISRLRAPSTQPTAGPTRSAVTAGVSMDKTQPGLK